VGQVLFQLATILLRKPLNSVNDFLHGLAHDSPPLPPCGPA
jgi:hypothetical protein